MKTLNVVIYERKTVSLPSNWFAEATDPIVIKELESNNLSSYALKSKYRKIFLNCFPNAVTALEENGSIIEQLEI